MPSRRDYTFIFLHFLQENTTAETKQLKQHDSFVVVQIIGMRFCRDDTYPYRKKIGCFTDQEME